MSIPDNIKENVRAVLLSKTDGSGILVSTFLKDYKSIIHQPLMYKGFGYQTLEKFIKDIPDVCRLEYSDQHMAFKLFGITKPNTFVSSFVKKAEGNTESDSSKKSSDRWEKIKPTEDLNEKWEPSARGLYSLCFPNRKNNGLTSREAISMKFAQLGEVVEINSIPTLTFIRYREEKAAKKAIELYGSELGLKRAEERVQRNNSGKNKNRKTLDESSGEITSKGSESKAVNGDGYKMTYVNKKADFIDDDDECWDKDDDGGGSSGGGQGVMKSSPGSYRGSETKQFESKTTHKMYSPGKSDSDSSNKERPIRTKGAKRTDNPLSPVQIYIGNWPNEANEDDLRSLLRPYNCITCRIVQSKDSKNKKFAFADLYNEEDAQKVIRELDNTVFKNRDLKCRLGKKKGAKVSNNDDTHSDNSVKQDKHTHKNFQSPKSNFSPKLNTSMPLLETPISPHSRMPPLEHVPDEMPPLEPVLSPAVPVTPDMPALENISPIKPVANGISETNSYNPVQLNVGNFPYGTTENELMQILGMYGALNITMMNNEMTSRSAYAFVDFCNVEEAMVAMENLDQILFKGRKLVVTLSNPNAVFQKQNTSHVSSQSYPALDMSQMSLVSDHYDKPDKRSQQNRTNYDSQRLTNTLQDYTKIATKLRAEEQFRCIDGMLLTVMITHVENDRFFWAQILQDSVNGDNVDLHHLETLAGQLQLERKTSPINGLGRCAAKYENEWFRAWCTYETVKNGEELGELIFIDYGNRTFCKKTEMFKAKPSFWTLPPMAKPFKLIDSKRDLNSCLNKVAKLEVIEAGTTRTNSVITVRAVHWL